MTRTSYVVLKNEQARYRTFGPVQADSPVAAVAAVAEGRPDGYVPQGRGRYVAVPLEIWQSGVFDYTKSRGVEKVPIAGASKVRVLITNDYSDGHHSESTVEVDAPTDQDDWLSEWFNDVVFPHTGDGHGTKRGLGSCHTAQIIAAPDPALVGKEYEWTD